MSEISNYIPISRRLFEHRFWCEERTYSRFEAWLDLVQMARFEDGKKYVGNRVLMIKRGQIHATYRFLSKRWDWSTNKVTGFLDLLVKDRMIVKETHHETGQTLVTIIKYDSYNVSRNVNEMHHETEKILVTVTKYDKYNVSRNVNETQNETPVKRE